jgi:tRNA threonylcarbamoyladenosine biosynthesis protein TsaE
VSPGVFESASVAQTEAAAAQLATTLTGGQCIALQGDLGAGKTQFVRGLVRALGGNPRRVSSPTFVLLNIYDEPEMRLAVYHLDAYRVHGPQDFEAIGFIELLELPAAVVVVEWADRIAELLPDGRIDVRITASSKRRRRIEVVSRQS